MFPRAVRLVVARVLLGVPAFAATAVRLAQVLLSLLRSLISLRTLAGKFYHRLRRNKPCVYTTDLATHLAARAETLKASKPPKDLGRGSSRRAEAPTPSSSHPLSRVKDGSRASSEERDSDEDNSGSSGSEDDGRGRRGVSPDLPFVNVGSPGTDNSSRLSSVSPPPAAAALPTFAPPQSAGASQDAQAMSQSQSQSQAASQPPPSIVRIFLLPFSCGSREARLLTVAFGTQEPLPWMVAAAADLRSKQTDDHFEIIPRPRPPDPNVQEWRIRCLDCPGKVRRVSLLTSAGIIGKLTLSACLSACSCTTSGQARHSRTLAFTSRTAFIGAMLRFV